MKRWFVSALVVGIAAALTGAEAPAAADVGSCYSVQPICMYPTQPACMCNASMQCFWACR